MQVCKHVRVVNNGLDCKAMGIEVVPARVEFCLDFFYELENVYNSKLPKKELTADPKQDSNKKSSSSSSG